MFADAARDFLIQVLGAGEDVARDHIALYLGKPDLHLVEPGRIIGCVRGGSAAATFEPKLFFGYSHCRRLHGFAGSRRDRPRSPTGIARTVRWSGAALSSPLLHRWLCSRRQIDSRCRCVCTQSHHSGHVRDHVGLEPMMPYHMLAPDALYSTERYVPQFSRQFAAAPVGGASRGLDFRVRSSTRASSLATGRTG